MARFLRWRSVASLVLQLAVLSLLIVAFFMRFPQVSGLSMEPLIHSGEYVLINTVAYRVGAPRRGEIVAFRHEGDAREVFIKRVIGVAGDRIRIDRGQVYVNGAKLHEPYVRDGDGRSVPEISVPPSFVYVLGDNRANSEDSRSFGAVSDDRLIGRAVAGVWPPSMLGAL